MVAFYLEAAYQDVTLRRNIFLFVNPKSIRACSDKSLNAQDAPEKTLPNVKEEATPDCKLQ